MTEQQAERLLKLVSIQLGVTIGCFVALLVLIVFVGSRRDGH